MDNERTFEECQQKGQEESETPLRLRQCQNMARQFKPQAFFPGNFNPFDPVVAKFFEQSPPVRNADEKSPKKTQFSDFSVGYILSDKCSTSPPAAASSTDGSSESSPESIQSPPPYKTLVDTPLEKSLARLAALMFPGTMGGATVDNFLQSSIQVPHSGPHPSLSEDYSRLSLPTRSVFSSELADKISLKSPTMVGSNSMIFRKQRTVFGHFQLMELERAFQRQQYMVGSDRLRLAQHLGLSETQVRIWFQNRRSKWRKDMRSQHHFC